MTNLQLIGLVAMSVALKDAKEPIEIDPGEFFGVQEEAEEIVAEPIAGLQRILKREIGLNWDGKSKLWGPVVELLKDDCRCEYVCATDGVERRRVEDAIEIVKYDKAIPGRIAPQKLKDAKTVIEDFDRKQKAKGIRQPGDDVSEAVHANN